MVSAEESAAVELEEAKLESSGETPILAPNQLADILPQAGFDRSELEALPMRRNLGDGLKYLPGVVMGGPPGQNKDVRLRGLDKEFTRLEFDGQQLPGGGEKREFKVDTISPLLVGEATVLRSPTAEYESDGIAGRVLVEPREIPQERRFEYQLGIGGISESDGSLSHDNVNGDYQRLSFFYGDRWSEHWGLTLGFDFTQNPFRNFKDVEKFDAGSGDLKETETENEFKPQESINVLANLEYSYGSGSFNLKPLYFDFSEPKDKVKLKNKFKSGTLDKIERETEDEGKDLETLGFTLEHSHRLEKWDAQVESDLSFFETSEVKNKTKDKFEDKLGGTGFEFKESEVEEEDKEDEFFQARSKYTQTHEWLGLPGEFKTGVHLRFRDRFKDKTKTKIKKDGTTEDKTEPKDRYELSEDLFMGFAQNEFQLSERFSVLPGVRVEATELSSTDGTGVTEDQSFVDVLPNLHLLYDLNERTLFRFAVSRSLNRPKFDEIAPFENETGNSFQQGNPRLDPARSWNFDLGFEYRTDRVFLAANLYHKEITDVIEAVDTGVDKAGKDVVRFENVGDGWVRGLELEQRYLWSGQLGELTAFANQALIDSELTEADGDTRAFNEQPDLIASFGFEYTAPNTGTSLSVATKYRDELEKVEDNGETETEDGVWFLDLSVRQPLSERLSLSFNALNLLNTGKDKKKFENGTLVETKTEEPGRFFSLELTGSF